MVLGHQKDENESQDHTHIGRATLKHWASDCGSLYEAAKNGRLSDALLDSLPTGDSQSNGSR